MSDEPFYAPNHKPAPAREPKPGELLFEFVIGHDRFVSELRDHGEVYGVECQFFKNEELLIAHRFDPRLDASRPSRELAIAWALEMTKALKRARSGDLVLDDRELVELERLTFDSPEEDNPR